MTETDHFGDAVIHRVRALGHPLCVGLDPHLGLIPELFQNGTMRPTDPRTATSVGWLMDAIIPRLAGRVAVVKPQLAFFEQIGPAGLTILAKTIETAREAGLLVLLDGKRGDIGSTAEAYARAWLGPHATTPGDALTVSPYLGTDTLQPFLDVGPESGVFVLVKTSNPGSGAFQDLEVNGRPIWLHVADALAETSAARRGPATGWSSLGAVIGATYPDQGERLRDALPEALFLVPGYGAQGGSARDAVRGFVQGPAGREGGIVSASRSILFPEAAATAGSMRDWDRAIDDAIDRAVGELGEVVAA